MFPLLPEPTPFRTLFPGFPLGMYLVWIVAAIVWFVAAALFSLFLPSTASAVIAVAVAVAAAFIVVMVLHNTRQFECPSCGYHKQLSS
jgi:hypothetical protein